MAMLFQLIGGICGLGSLICWILVLIQMFKHGQTVLAIVSIVLICLVIGPFIAFVYGWIKSTEWNIKQLMLAWTGCIVIGIICNVLVMVMTGAAVAAG